MQHFRFVIVENQLLVLELSLDDLPDDLGLLVLCHHLRLLLLLLLKHSFFLLQQFLFVLLLLELVLPLEVLDHLDPLLLQLEPPLLIHHQPFL